MKTRLLLSTLLCLLMHSSLFAQKGILKGQITEDGTRETLIGVNVAAKNETTDFGTVTDYDGNYTLELATGQYQLILSYVGFEKIEKSVTIRANETTQLDVVMKESALLLDDVVVSVGRFEKKISEEVNSIEVVTSESIANQVPLNLQDAVRTVTSLQVVDGQPSIRGGSGFAYGAGSRVIIVIDGQPMMTGDRGDVKWGYLPIENIEQIEVMKGAASVLYGANALNGIINIKTAEPTTTPFTSMTTYGKVYDSPKRAVTKWWDSPRFVNGMLISHRQKIGRVGLVIGGNFHDSKSYLEGYDETRARLSIKTRYHFNNDRLTAGINANVSQSREGIYVIWKNAEEGIYSQDNTDSYYTFRNWNVDPWLTYFDKYEGSHKIKGRFYRTLQELSNENNSGDIYNLDYQYGKSLKHNFNLILGSTLTYVSAKSKEFDDTKAGIFALFSQVDKKFGAHSLSAGIRSEVFSVPNEKTRIVPSFRLGANFLARERSNIRLSFGQGYRYPSALERFLDLKITDQISVFPNPELKPEIGWSAEIGWRRGFGNKKFGGNFDIAGFWQEYTNYVEFLFNYYPEEDGGLLDKIGFKTENILKARIAGIEANWDFRSQINDDMSIGASFGYTYLYPVNLSPYINDTSTVENDTIKTIKNVGTYLANAVGAFSADNTDPSMSNLMKYRFQHTANANIDFAYKNITLGATVNYYSPMNNTDPIFIGIPEIDDEIIGGLVEAVLASQGGPIQGLEDWRTQNNTGNTIINVRASYAFSETKRLLFGVENLLNNEYAIRPAKLEAPRTYVFQFKYTF